MEETSEKKVGKNDLLTGSVLKKLTLFFLPIAAGTLFQQLYNAVDAFVVSKFVGTNALAAVGGSPATTSNLVIGFFVALTAGCAVLIAQQFGSGDVKNSNDAIKTSFLFCAGLGLIVWLLMVIFSPQILHILKTTDEAYEDSLLYQRIYFSGTVLLLVFNMGSGILRAIGNSKFPFICLFVSCGVNIVLDVVFVAVFKWGVAGVAWATIVAEGISATMITVKLFVNKGEYRLRLKSAKFSLKSLGAMLKIGVPSGIQSSMYGISNLILQVGVNSLGTLVVASWAMSGKVDGVFWAITNAFGTAITAFVGQNYGAKNFKRIKECNKKGLAMLAIMTVCISAILMLLGKYILGILTDDQSVVDTTMQIMTYFVPFYITWTIIEVTTAVLRGVGDTIVPSIIQAIGICVLRIIWVYTIFKTYPTLFVLSMSYAVSWVVTDMAISIYYFKKSKKLFAVAE